MQQTTHVTLRSLSQRSVVYIIRTCKQNILDSRTLKIEEKQTLYSKNLKKGEILFEMGCVRDSLGVWLLKDWWCVRSNTSRSLQSDRSSCTYCYYKWRLSQGVNLRNAAESSRLLTADTDSAVTAGWTAERAMFSWPVPMHDMKDNATRQ